MAKKKTKQTKRERKAARVAEQTPEPGQQPTHAAVPIQLHLAVLEKLNELPRKEVDAMCRMLEQCITIAVPENVKPGQIFDSGLSKPNGD